MISEPSPSPFPLAFATSRVQFRWGTVSSGVSSMVTILFSGGRKVVRAFRVVVLPLAVSPETNIDIPYSRQIQR